MWARTVLLSSTAGGSRPRFAAMGIVLMVAATGIGSQPAAQSRSITIAWDQNPENTVIGYRVHVGTRSGNYTESHDVGNVTSFSYQAGVAGFRYYFAVSAYAAGGLESARSAEVSAVAEAPNDEPAQITPLMVRARGLPEVASLAALPDGRLMVVEPQRIRVMAEGTLIDEPALTLGRSGAHLTQIVIAPAFIRTHHVFVGVVEIAPDGKRQFHISRYRELQNTLGEGASIVSNLEIRDAGDPFFAIDDVGQIYVAMPGDDADGDAYAGRLLRFDSDGKVPSDSTSTSPVFAKGFARPSGLKWDGETLWASHLDSSWPDALTALTPDSGPTRSWRRGVTSEMVDSSIPAAQVRSFDIARDAAGSLLVAYVDSADRLRMARIQGDAIIQATAENAESGSVPLAVLIGPAHDVYVALHTNGAFEVRRYNGLR